MKKDRKRLQLQTETVRSLSQTQLARAGGGINKTDYDSACSYTNIGCHTAYCGTDNITQYCATSEYCP